MLQHVYQTSDVPRSAPDRCALVSSFALQHPWQAHYLAEFIKELLHAEPTHRMTPDVMEGHEVFTDFDIVAFNSGAMKNPVKGP